MSQLAPARAWQSPAPDPGDTTLGDVVTAASLDDLGGFDVVVLGEPFDAGVMGRPGAAEGPSAIRAAAAGVNTHHYHAGDLVGLGIGDLGNVRVESDHWTGPRVTVIHEAVAAVAARVHEADALPVFLGGDSSLTHPNARPLLDRGSLGLVALDAHLDAREVRRAPTSGTQVRQLYEDGLGAFVCVGARDFETSTGCVGYVRDRGGVIVTVEEAGELDAALARVTTAVEGVEQVYVSLDVDVLDSAVAPGVSAPTPGGLTAREVFGVVHALGRDERVVGFEVVECAPPLDHAGRTSDVAARALAHFLVGYQEGGIGL